MCLFFFFFLSVFVSCADNSGVRPRPRWANTKVQDLNEPGSSNSNSSDPVRSRISRSGSSSRDSSVPRVLLTQILSKSSHGTCSLGMPKKIPRVMNPLCFFWNFRSVPFRLAFGMWSGIRSDSSVSAPALFMTHQQQLSYCLFVVDQGALIRTSSAKIPTKARHSQCPLLRSAASPDSDLVLCHKNIPRVNPGMIFVLPHKVGS